MNARTPVTVTLLDTDARIAGPGVLAALEALGVRRIHDVGRKAFEHAQRRPVQIAAASGESFDSPDDGVGSNNSVSPAVVA